MHCNEAFFPNRQPTQDVKLDAFNLRSNSSGGLRSSARVVSIPSGSTLLRLFMQRGGAQADFGCWWFTPFEFKRIADHFGVDPTLMISGREGGKSALHGALALLSEWYSDGAGPSEKHMPNAAQLSRFHAVRTRSAMYAMYGEGDAASTTGYGRVLKPMKISDGKGGYGAAKQLFLPQPWTYKNKFTFLTPPGGGVTDQNLSLAYPDSSQSKLPFE